MDGKSLLKILKSETPPPFGAIPIDQIIFDFLQSMLRPEPQKYPTVLILCGPPGSGKSTVKDEILQKSGIQNYLTIDTDLVREILMSETVKSQLTPFPETKSGFELLRGITNAFNTRMINEAQNQRFNIVFDTTGRNYAAIKYLIGVSKINQYKSIFAIVSASLQICLERVNRRNEDIREKGLSRIELPLAEAEFIYSQFMNPVATRGTASMYLIGPYKVNPDVILVYDNNTDNVEPVLLFHKEGPDVLFSTDFSDFYNMQITKYPPIISVKSSGGKKNKKKTRRHKKSKKQKKTKRRR